VIAQHSVIANAAAKVLWVDFSTKDLCRALVFLRLRAAQEYANRNSYAALSLTKSMSNIAIGVV